MSLATIKRVLSESSLLKITHTGTSVIDDGWGGCFNYHHFKVDHPNGAVQHVSYDPSEGDLIRHKKDPTSKPYGAIAGKSELRYKPDDSNPQDIEDAHGLIRAKIKPQTKVNMIR